MNGNHVNVVRLLTNGRPPSLAAYGSARQGPFILKRCTDESKSRCRPTLDIFGVKDKVRRKEPTRTVYLVQAFIHVVPQAIYSSAGSMLRFNINKGVVAH